MAALLGIHYADLRIVSVYEGSTVVEFEVLDSEAEGDDGGGLGNEERNSKIAKQFAEAMQSMDSFMGSMILSAIA